MAVGGRFYGNSDGPSTHTRLSSLEESKREATMPQGGKVLQNPGRVS